jgi:3-oxoadipate enol-lactonase
VVLVGSLGATLDLWDPQVAALAERYRVVRFDTRGHGRSPVPPGPYSIDDLTDDLVALLDTVGAERAHVVGLSLGGMTALRLAIREPDRVDRLVLMCTSAYVPPAQSWTDRAALVRAEGPAAVAPTVVGRWLTEPRRHSHPQDVERLVTMISATPREGYAACCEAIAAMDQLADLPLVRAATLVIGGDEDSSIPAAHQEALAAGIEGARLQVLRAAAHLVTLEHADAVNALLLEHLGGDD